MTLTTVKGSVLNRGVNVKDFGAVGDGVTDDTAAIQAAIDTGNDISFPDGTYLVSSQITINTAGQQLTSFYSGSNEFGGANITFTQDGVCILVTQAQSAITNLRFVGPRTGADVAIKASKTTNTDDIDFSVSKCSFKTCTTAVNVIGRSLTAIDNSFANCTTCMELSWPTSGVDATAPEQGLPLGFRATRIIDNRAHSCTSFIETTGTDRQYFRGALIANNQMDIGEKFFIGGIIDSVISSNVVEMANSTIIYIDAGGTDLTITGNILNGTDGDAAQSPARAIWFDTGSTPKNITISGNSISYMDTDCILFVPNMDYVSITGNYFGPTGTRGLAHSGSMYRTSIVGNVFNLDAGSTCITGTTAGLDMSACTITDNSFEVTKTFLGSSPNDLGNNTIGGRGRIHYGSVDFPVRSLEVSTTSSVFAQFTRTGSTSGVGFDIHNDSGNIQIFTNPSGANAGSFAPGGDNSVSSGTASARWSVVYAGTGTINTSDARGKTFLTIEDAEKAAALEIKANLRKFKFNDAIESKGNDARIHFGASAQQVSEILANHGLAPEEYAFYCYDEWEAEFDEESNQILAAGNRYGIRYEELLAFIISAM